MRPKKFSPSPSRPSPHGRGNGTWKRHLCILLGFFALSRAIAFAAGVRFAYFDFDFMHYLDPRDVAERFWSSLWYLHTQPPLFNFLLGGAQRLFGNAAPAVLHLFYGACGIAMGIAVYATQRYLGCPERWALVTTTVLLLSPASILYENFLFHTYPAAAALAVLCALFAKALRRAEAGDAEIPLAGIVALATALVLYRTLFQHAWLLATMLFLLCALPGQRRRVGRLAVLPLVLLVLLQAKNYLAVGSLTSSSWLGLNLAQSTVFSLPDTTRRDLIAAGALSPVSSVPTLQPLEAYGRWLQPRPPTGVPMLDAPRKSTGAINFHALAFAEVSQRYLQDATWVMWHKPGFYLRNLLSTYVDLYLLAPSNFRPLAANRRRMADFDRWFYTIAYGRWAPAPSPSAVRASASNGRNILGWLWATVPSRGVFLLFGWPTCLLAALWSAWCSWRRGKRAYALAVWFIVFNVATITMVSIACERRENMRFRYLTSPLVTILLGVVRAKLWARVWGHKRPGDDSFERTDSSVYT